MQPQLKGINVTFDRLRSHAWGEALHLLFMLLVVVLSGCAGGRVEGPVDPGLLEGRLVESVTLQDQSTVVFDPWESASAGRDKRARIKGEFVEGYVGGTLRRYDLAEVVELRMGADDRGGTTAKVAIGAVLVLAGVVAMFFLIGFGWDPG